MIVGTPHGRRNPQFLGVHADLFSIKRAGISEVIADVGMQITWWGETPSSHADAIIWWGEALSSRAYGFARSAVLMTSWRNVKRKWYRYRKTGSVLQIRTLPKDEAS